MESWHKCMPSVSDRESICVRESVSDSEEGRYMEWNEANFDIAAAPLYVRQAYEAKKYAFVGREGSKHQQPMLGIMASEPHGLWLITMLHMYDHRTFIKSPLQLENYTKVSDTKLHTLCDLSNIQERIGTITPKAVKEYLLQIQHQQQLVQKARESAAKQTGENVQMSYGEEDLAVLPDVLLSKLKNGNNGKSRA